jgi:hypothetical protein
MQELLEAIDQDGTYWPHYDDEIRTRVHLELGIPMPFNPQEHLIQLPKRVKDKKTQKWMTIDEDYLEVRWRLVWFRDRFPHGSIVTEEVEVDLDRVVTIQTTTYDEETHKRETTSKTGTGYARYKTTVTDGEGGVATGYGTENAAAFADYVERAETRSIGRALAALGVGTQFIGQEMTELDHVADDTVKVSASPFVGSAPPGPASTAVQDSAGLGASGMPSPRTTPITSKKPPVMKRPELLIAIKMQFTRLAGQDQQLAQDFCRDIWGNGVSSWKMVESLSDASLRTGLSKLEKKRPEQPLAVPLPAGEGATPSPEDSSSASGEGDVPTFPPPEGNTQEGPQSPPGSTIVDGPSRGEGGGLNGSPKRCAIVQEGTGIPCAREVREDGTHEGNHYFDPGRPEARPVKLPAREQVIVVPDPDTGVRYISTSDGMLLRQFCQQHDLMEFFTVAVAKSPRNLHGNIMIAERQYWQMRAFVEAQVGMGSPEVSA